MWIAGTLRGWPSPDSCCSARNGFVTSEGSMLRFFQAMMPREERFFALFDRHAATLVSGATALRDLLEGGSVVPEACRRIVAFENEADTIAREVLMTVRRSFITPF